MLSNTLCPHHHKKWEKIYLFCWVDTTIEVPHALWTVIDFTTLVLVVFFTPRTFFFGLPTCLVIWDVPTLLGLLIVHKTRDPSSNKHASIHGVNLSLFYLISYIFPPMVYVPSLHTSLSYLASLHTSLFSLASLHAYLSRLILLHICDYFLPYYVLTFLALFQVIHVSLALPQYTLACLALFHYMVAALAVPHYMPPFLALFYILGLVLTLPHYMSPCFALFYILASLLPPSIGTSIGTLSLWDACVTFSMSMTTPICPMLNNSMS